VRLAASEREFEELLGSVELESCALLRRVALQKNLRDVRHAPGGGVRNVLYHLAIYAGRTEIVRDGFHPQAAEISALDFFAPADVDRMLLAGQLAPNMAFLWLTQGQALLALAARPLRER